MPPRFSGTRPPWPTRLAFLLAALALILSRPGPAGAADAVRLQLAWKHQFQFAGYYAALHKGFYRAAGLDVTILEGGRGRFAREEVLAGRADFGVAGAELLLQRAEGSPFVVLAAIFQHSASILLTRADAGISHPQDLIGRRMMLLPGNKDADILAIFQNEGIPLDRIERVDQTYNLDDLISGRVDSVSAYLTNEPWLMQKAGVAPGVILPQTYGVDFYSDCLFTTERQIADHPDRVARFRAACLAGWEYAMDHPEEIIDLLINEYRLLKSREHLRYEAQAMSGLIFPKLVEMGHMNPGRWRHIADTFARLGALPPKYPLDGFLYDPDPKPDLGKWKMAIFGLLLGLALSGLLLLIFARLNHALKAEVAERRRAEASLMESESRLRTIFDTSRAGIILVNPQGVIAFANQGMADLFGCPLDALIGSTYPSHIHPDQRDTGDERMRLLIAGEIDSVAVERHYIRADGSDFWGFLNGRRHVDEQGNLIFLVGIIADVTQRRRLEADLRHAHKMESIGTLTGGVAHDFNNILSIIVGNAELAMDDVPEWSPARPHLKAILTAGTRAAAIVRQLLNFTRKDDGRRRPMDIVRSVRQAVDFLRATIPADIEIRKILPEAAPETALSETALMVEADPAGIHQVLMNLMANAAQAMEEAGGTLEIAVAPARLQEGDRAPAGNYVKITVRDSGPGIDPYIIDRIFDPYFTTRPVGKGSGMGLAVAHGIIKSHGGVIFAESLSGQGSVFTILLPRLLTPAP